MNNTDELTPLCRVELLYDQLLHHYGDAQDKDIRAAAKLLLVALDRFSRSQSPGWEKLVDEYVSMARHDPIKFSNVLKSNRSHAPSN